MTMTAITVYLKDSQQIYVGSQQVDPFGRMPSGAVLTAPPELTGVQVARWIGQGWEVLAERPPEPAPTRDALAAALRIDAEADAIRNAVLGGRTTEYQDAYADALAFKAAGYASDPVPTGVKTWYDAKTSVGAGWTAQQCADDIIATGASWKAAQDAIRAARLLRKLQIVAAGEQIVSATTLADLTAAVANFDAALAGWNAFVVAIKTELGQ
jgi:hypothetical protein